MHARVGPDPKLRPSHIDLGQGGRAGKGRLFKSIPSPHRLGVPYVPHGAWLRLWRRSQVESWVRLAGVLGQNRLTLATIAESA